MFMFKDFKEISVEAGTIRRLYLALILCVVISHVV